MFESNAEESLIKLFMEQVAFVMSVINQNQNRNNERGKFSKYVKSDSQNDNQKKGRFHQELTRVQYF